MSGAPFAAPSAIGESKSERSTLASAPCLARVACFARVLGAAFAVLGLLELAACDELDPRVGDLAVCDDVDSNPAVTVSFKAQIRPLMKGEGGGRPCGDCHSPTKGTHEGFDEVGLDLTSLGTLRNGGRNTGVGIIVPGSPCRSPIVQKLRGTFGGARMPKNGPYWTPEQIQLMKDWIAEGAVGEDSE